MRCSHLFLVEKVLESGTGNEAGDLDSMTSALLWAFHLSHLKKPVDAVALLQTEADALDLRPYVALLDPDLLARLFTPHRENTLALANANMSPKHRDLLSAFAVFVTDRAQLSLERTVRHR